MSGSTWGPESSSKTKPDGANDKSPDELICSRYISDPAHSILSSPLPSIHAKKAPPLLNSHEYIMSSNVAGLDLQNDDDLNAVLVKFTILHGKLVEVIKKAQEPSSDKGEEISVVEKKEIFEAIKSIEDKIMKLKISIDKKN